MGMVYISGVSGKGAKSTLPVSSAIVLRFTPGVSDRNGLTFGVFGKGTKVL